MGGKRPSTSQGSWETVPRLQEPAQGWGWRGEGQSPEQPWKAEEIGLWVGASPTWTVPVDSWLVLQAFMGQPGKDKTEEPKPLAGPHSVDFLWTFPLLSPFFQSTDSKRDMIASKRPGSSKALFPIYCTWCGTLRRQFRTRTSKSEWWSQQLLIESFLDVFLFAFLHNFNPTSQWVCEVVWWPSTTNNGRLRGMWRIP